MFISVENVKWIVTIYDAEEHYKCQEYSNAFGKIIKVRSFVKVNNVIYLYI